MTSAFIGAGLAQGGANVAKHEQGRELRETQLAHAKTMQKSAQAQFEENQEMRPLRKSESELQIQQLQNQVAQGNRQNVQDQTFAAFKRFDADGNVKHINTWLQNVKKNPVGQRMHGTTMRVDPLVRSPENDRLLVQFGIPNPQQAYSDQTKNLVLATKSDGTQVVADMNELRAGTGYTKYMTDEERDARQQEAQITAMLRQGQSPAKTDKIQKVIESLMASNPDMTYAEAYEQVQSMGKAGASLSGDQAGIKQIMDENPSLPYLDAAQQWFDLKNKGRGTSDRSKYIQDYLAENQGATTMDAQNAYDARVPTSTQKEVGSIEQVKDKLDDMNFLEMDMSKATPQERKNVHRLIAQIEDFRDLKFSTEEKRTMRDFRNLSTLAGQVTDELSEEQTGLLDNMLSGVKGYLFNDVGGKPAKAAYQTFGNIMLKTMSGAAVSDQEMKRMVKAAGSANLQLKPLLSAFRVQVQTIKSQLEAIRDQNDPDLAHYYLGGDIDEIDDTIRRLDTRLGDLRQAGIETASAGGFRSSAEVKKDLGEKIKSQDSTGASGAPVDFDALFKEVSGE